MAPCGRPTLLCSLLFMRESTVTGIPARARERIKAKRRMLHLLAMSFVLILNFTEHNWIEIDLDQPDCVVSTLTQLSRSSNIDGLFV